MKFKKKLGAFLLASTLLFGSALVGCDNSGGGHKPPKVSYYVEVPTNDEYTINGVVDGQEFYEGDLVEFTITVTRPGYVAIDNVYYAENEECEKVGETYSFEMPGDNVTLRVTYHEIDRFSLSVDPSPIVVGIPSKAVLKLGVGAYDGDYTIVKEEGGTGDVEIINDTSVKGLTAGTVKLNAQVEGVSVLDEPLEVTVRDPQPGETKELAFTADEAWQKIGDESAGWPDKESPVEYYVKGTVKEFISVSDEYDKVEVKLECSKGQFTVYRADCKRGSELREKFDMGSFIYVKASLKLQGSNTRETSWGEIVDVINDTPYKLYSDETTVIVKPGEEYETDVRIAPRGSSSDAITYESDNNDIATVNENGVISGVSEGTAKITAKSGTYDDVTITVVVGDLPAGDKEHPLSVDDAILLTSALPAGGTSSKTYYIKGPVSKVVKAEAADSRFYIMGSDVDFYCFKVTVEAEALPNLVKGAEVLLHAKLKNYVGDDGKSTYETDYDGVVDEITKDKVSLLLLKNSLLELSLNEGDFDLEGFGATYPEGLPTDPITYESGNEEVFVVDDGAICPVAVGEAVLTARSGSLTRKCTVKVSNSQVLVAATSVDESTEYFLGSPLSSGKVFSTAAMGTEAIRFYIAGTTDLEEAATAKLTDSGVDSEFKYVITLTKGETVKTLGVASNGTGSNKHYNLGFVGDVVPDTNPEVPYVEAKFKFTSDHHLQVVCDDKTLYVGTQDGKSTISLGDATKVIPSYLYTLSDPVPATSVSVTPIEAELVPGGTVELTATIQPDNSTDSITWSSSDENVAIVNPTTGVVTAIANGNVTITAKARRGVQATCAITVSGEEINYGTKDNPITPEQCRALLEDKESGTILPKKVFVRGNVVSNTAKDSNNQYNIFVDNAEGTDAEYFEFFRVGVDSSVTGLPTNANGLRNYAVTVTGWATKTTYQGQIIYEIGNKKSADEYENGSIVAASQVEAPEVTDISLPETAEVEVNKSTSLKLTVLPVRATATGVVWSASNNKVNINSSTGAITGVTEGEVIITATYGGLSATCTLTVVSESATISFGLTDFPGLEGTSSPGVSSTATKNGLSVAISACWEGSRGQSYQNVRIGKNATVTFSGKTITKIEFVCDRNNKETSYGIDGFVASTGTLTDNGETSVSRTGTWVGESDSLVLTASVHNVRLISMVVYYK